MPPVKVPILFESDRFVAADKPAGWLSVPSRLGASDERPCVGRVLEAQLNTRLWPVHRLDFEVTGILLFAKDAPAHSTANQWFEQRLVSKTYEAITDLGQPPIVGLPLRWEGSLLRGKKRAYESPHGKPSLTLATPRTILALQDGSAILWDLEPHTGRSHQLRFDLARHGYPIIGDQLYGSRRIYQTDSIALRCVRLDFSSCPAADQLGLPGYLATTHQPIDLPIISPNTQDQL